LRSQLYREYPGPAGSFLLEPAGGAFMGLASYRAARQNHLQRSVNLSLGSALSTIGLSIPTMIIISLLTGAQLELDLPPAESILLVLLFITQMTFSGAPTNVLLGGVHLVLFAAFVRADLQSLRAGRPCKNSVNSGSQATDASTPDDSRLITPETTPPQFLPTQRRDRTRSRGSMIANGVLISN
jgi:hypothetical protein